ncbi:GNAT family N-acetyltransferase [Floccifex sp.]|uniref:GNAT family N-acetyltransferase n=1 Tax=Floccifex sp. TaxID=2815810 RepID=UPI003F0DF522
MILHNAIGLEQDIQSLLEKSLLNMDKTQIKAWMKHEFDASSMFCMVVDNKVVSCLQTKRRFFFHNGSSCTSMVITMAATLPDYRQQKYFSSLLDAALEKSACNDLLTIVYTTFPKLFETRSFSLVSKTLLYSLGSDKCEKGNEKNVVLYNDSIDLYPVYCEFMSCFDGSIRYSKKEFENQIQFVLQSQKKILVMKKDNEIRGFIVFKGTKEYAKIDYLIYLDSQAIYDGFHYLSLRFPALTFIGSEFERFEKLFLLDYPRHYGCILARLNHYKLFSQWANQEVGNAASFFDSLEKPIWMHVIE